ncbi:LamG-like jellyroll fold domain-containing protein, partial [Limnohabitans sp. Rim28]|uniref:LamG-like jellyroll fold domain-containing protein n=1 Tax=Limnohabitans sp. Rim28 TaxID=1100720 RepID=UPI000593A8BD
MDGTASSAQLALLGVTVTNVTPDNLKAVQNAIGAADPTSLTALQTAVDNAISAFNNASALIANYADTNGGTAPQASDYTAAGVTGIGGVGQPTVAMINEALATGEVIRAEADSAADVQAIVNAYQVILNNANTASSTDASASDYLAIGVTGVTSGDVHTLMGQVIDGRDTSHVNTVAKIQALATTVAEVIRVAGLSSPVRDNYQNIVSTLSVGELSNIGITGATGDSRMAWLQAIAGKSPADITTLSDLQNVITAVVHPTTGTYTLALNALREAATNNNATASNPAVSVWEDAGIVNVNSSNLASRNSLLNMAGVTGVSPNPVALDGDHDTVVEFRAMVGAYDLLLSSLDNTDNNNINLTNAQITALGLKNVIDLVDEKTLFNDVLDQATALEVNTGVKLEQLANIVDKIMLHASGNSQTITEAELEQIGIDETILTAGRASALLTSITSAGGANNVDTLAKITALIDVTVPTAPSFALASDTGTSTSDGITNVGTVSVSGVEANGSWQFSTDSGITWSASQTAATTSFTLAEGTFAAGQLRVRSYDVAGNVSAVTQNAGAIVIDTAAPVADLDGTSSSTVDAGSPIRSTAYSTNGADNSGLYMGTTNALGLTAQGFTLQTWFKLDSAVSLNAYDRVFSIAPGGQSGYPNNEIMVWVNTNALGKTELGFEGPNITAFNDDVSLPVNTWHHLAVTVDGSKKSTLYLDGVAIDSRTSTGTFTPVNSEIWMGRISTAQTPFGLDATFADARVYKRGLTQAEVRDNMGGQLNVSDPDLIKSYQFTNGNRNSDIAGDSAATTTGTVTSISTAVPLSLDVKSSATLTDDHNIASITVKGAGMINGTSERLHVGDDFIAWTSASGSVSLFGTTWSYTYNSTESAYTFTSGSAITAPMAQDFLRQLGYANALGTGRTAGTRSFAITLTDMAGNTSAPVTASMSTQAAVGSVAISATGASGSLLNAGDVVTVTATYS